MSDRALRFAMTLSPDVVAVHLLGLTGPEEHEDVVALRHRFDAEVAGPIEAMGGQPPRLVLLPAPFRDIQGPMLKLVERIDEATPGRSVAILVPELVLKRWWQRPLHGRRAAKLRNALVAHAGPRVMVITSPWKCLR
jgi:hypothetical protein